MYEPDLVQTALKILKESKANIILPQDVVVADELNEKANRVAFAIMAKQQIKADTLVSLYLDRSEYLLIGILGILKAGGAYVPIDPKYPHTKLDRQHLALPILIFFFVIQVRGL